MLERGSTTGLRLGSPMEKIVEGLKEQCRHGNTEGNGNPIERPTVSTNLDARSSHRLSHQPKNIQGLSEAPSTYVAED